MSRGLAPPSLFPPTCSLPSPNQTPLSQVMQGLMKRLTLTPRPSYPFAGFLPSQRLFEVLLPQQSGPSARGRRCGTGSLTPGSLCSRIETRYRFSCLCVCIFALASAVPSAFRVARSNPPTFSFSWIEPWSTRRALNTHPELNYTVFNLTHLSLRVLYIRLRQTRDCFTFPCSLDVSMRGPYCG